jgi:hypothetical protein
VISQAVHGKRPGEARCDMGRFVTTGKKLRFLLGTPYPPACNWCYIYWVSGCVWKFR